MAKDTSFFKTLVVPAIISLVLFLLGTYILLPAWRRYRARYAQYLPIDSWHPQSLRERLAARWTAYANRREDQYLASAAHDIDHQDEQIDDGDGEELGTVDDYMRQAIERHARSARSTPDHTRRLSRDLEEGFRDDSDDEPDR